MTYRQMLYSDLAALRERRRYATDAATMRDLDNRIALLRLEIRSLSEAES